MIDKYVLYAIIFFFVLGLTILCCRLILPFLKKCAEQPIYEEGPSWHSSKAGTPTMGGISFLTAITLSLLICSLIKFISRDYVSAISLILCVFYAVLNAVVGIIDDTTKLRHKKNAGLTPRTKLIFQFLITALFLFLRKQLLGINTSVTLSFLTVDLGFFYYFFVLIILVGITNCANLTDGVDGLASSVAFGIGVSLFYVCAPDSDVSAYISISITAATLGFLFFNAHPAKVFMGDTGSLFLGSLIGALAIELNNPLVAVISGGVYVIEGLSVIIQVLYFKLYKRRLFKMAPIHHHLEKIGWEENKICLCALILTLVLAIPSLIICLR